MTIAGGLDGFSLHLFISLIEEFGASIDAEGKLMNNDDRLDHAKVKSYIRTAKTIKGFKREVKNNTTDTVM